MPHKIHQSSVSMFRVGQLNVADKSGTGNCVLTAESGTSILVNGHRTNLTSHTVNYLIDQSESGKGWINGSSSSITFTLPGNAASGTLASFLRTGGSVGVNPGGSANFWHMGSGLFYPNGQVKYLQSSGAMLTVISDGQNHWYPIVEKGTIS
jgi:hypothetical protein